MKGTIKLGLTDVEMVANAASPYVYRSIFKEDFLAKIREPEPDTDLFQKMGFVMMNQAKTAKMSELMNISVDAYYEWLVQFDPLDIINATEEISNLYLAQTTTLSSPKE